MQFTSEHEQLRKTVAKFVQTEINPHVDAWEEAEQFPAHDVFKKLGDLGLLGIKYDPAVTAGSDSTSPIRWSWRKSWAAVHCGGVPMAIGVHTDMCDARA